MDDDVLGTPKAWQIKDFPEGLRNRVIAASREAGQSVAEYMTAVIVRHLDSAGPVNGFANPVNQNETASRRVNVAEIKELVEASARLKEMPDDDIKKDARAAIKDGFRQARGLPPLKPRTPPKPKQPALAEPEEAARINDKLPAPAIEG